MTSIVPFYFRNIFSDRGGPVARVQSGEFSVFSQHAYQASAFLKPELIGEKKSAVMFGAADGIGSSEKPAAAQNNAISEALERWAYLDTYRSGEKQKFGFNVDRTSNGMAALPGFAWQARRKARLAALERYALIGWWDQQFGCSVHRAPYPDVGMVRIHHGQDFGEVVVLYHRAHSGFMSYGTAAGSTVASAAARAAIELVRCEYVISRHRARGAITPVRDHLERRCLYFSTPEGHAQFLEKVYAKPTKSPMAWEPLFDGEIRGPWSKWARVWRHAVVMPSYDFLDHDANYFFW